MDNYVYVTTVFINYFADFFMARLWLDEKENELYIEQDRKKKIKLNGMLVIVYVYARIGSSHYVFTVFLIE